MRVMFTLTLSLFARLRSNWPSTHSDMWGFTKVNRASQQCWGVTAGKARHNSSNVRGVTAGKMGRNASIYNGPGAYNTDISASYFGFRGRHSGFSIFILDLIKLSR